MKSSIKDKAEGSMHKAKGKIKEMAGRISNDPLLEAKGLTEKASGKTQEEVGHVKKVLGQ